MINKVERIVPNLNDQEKYVVCHRASKRYINLGLKTKKIRSGISFIGKPWLRDYIELSTNLHAKATNKFEKDLFKLMNNSVFGKNMEDIRNFLDVRLINKRKKVLKLAAKSNYKHPTIFNEYLIAIQLGKKKLVFDKPVYCGMRILDISKTLMYDFHYN